VNPFKNLVVNLSAAGISAVAGIWLICVTMLAIFAPDNANAAMARSALMFFGGVLATALILARRD
jgi:hypothetical protein